MKRRSTNKRLTAGTIVEVLQHGVLYVVDKRGNRSVFRFSEVQGGGEIVVGAKVMFSKCVVEIVPTTQEEKSE